MKGLLIKDIMLMKEQKNFFLLFIAVSLGTLIFSEDVSFTLGFFPFVISLFTLSTISIDEFDNGCAFLFTLPVTRRDYVREKYGLGLMLGLGALVFSVLLCLGACLRGSAAMLDVFSSALALLPALLIILAVMIPFQLKFGGEKGRIALIGALALLALLVVALVKLAALLGFDLGTILPSLPSLGVWSLFALLLAVSVAALLLSMKISVSIMEKKEF